MPTVVVLLLVLFEVLDRAESNELIVETFENLDFGFNSHSIHQLIAALTVFGVISVLLAVTVVIFRIYLYCRNDSNIRQYQHPNYDVEEPDGLKHKKAPRNSFQATFIHTIETV